MLEKSTLNNGIRVVTEQLPHAESVSIGLLFGRGSRHESEHEHGITHFIEHMLLKAADADAELERAKLVDAIGGPLNAYTAREYSLIHLHTIAENFSVAAELLGNLLTDVDFSTAKVEHERQIILHEIRHQQHDSSAYIHDLFSSIFWSTSSLGNAVAGSLESVSDLAPASIEKFYRNEYLGSCLIVAVAGNVSHASAVKAFAPMLEQIRPSTIPGPNYDDVCVQRAVEVHPRPDSRVHICFGFPAVNQTDPRRFAALLLDCVWGGGMSSRIFQHIRERHGWAYNLFSYLNSYSDTGAMVTAIETDGLQAVRVLNALCNQADALVEQGISQSELDRARKLLQVRFRMGLDSTHVRMERLAMNEFYRNEASDVEALFYALSQINLDDMDALISDLMRDEHLVACVLGDIDSTGQALHNVGLTPRSVSTLKIT
jgi:predicted Zn-dependent peptidase